MSNHIFVLDPGHCGIAPRGLYLRKGKQSPEVPPGIYEGEFNRMIATSVSALLDYRGVENVVTVPGPVSPRDKERIAFVNALHAKTGNCVYIGIHANASAETGWSSANGFKVFVSKSWFTGQLSKSGCRVAEYIDSYLREGTRLTARSISGARFSVLTKTKCPAVLCELGFMTNRTDSKYLASTRGRHEVSLAIADALTRYDND